MKIDLSNIKAEMDAPEPKVKIVDGVGRMKAKIHQPPEVFIIRALLKTDDPSVESYLVGGAIRDYLFHKFHTDQSQPCKIKDYDLATNLSEEEILTRLSTPEAKRMCVSVKEKESVDTFGVVFVGVNGKGPFEVAPYRKDVGSSDGRHPDKVERANIKEDAMRRDFTVNNLYYDFELEEILDFNPNAQGIEDVKNRVIRTVGDPFDRFDEDKLRILRMVRFFSRYNEGLIVEHLDACTLDAIDHFKDLMIYKGMSAERIQLEFISGLAQSLNTASYLKNYQDLDLFNAVFSSTPIDVTVINKLGNLKNPRVVLSQLLRNQPDVWSLLNHLKYPNSISDPVDLICKMMTFDPADAVDVLKARDRRLVKTGKKKTELTAEEEKHNKSVKDETIRDAIDTCFLIDDPWRQAVIEFTSTFETTVPSGEHFMSRGYEKEQIGVKQREYLQTSYSGALSWHLKRRNSPPKPVQ